VIEEMMRSLTDFLSSPAIINKKERKGMRKTMTLKLPEKVKIGPYWFTVRSSNDLKDFEQDIIYGQWDGAKQEIIIRSGASPERQIETLWHEIGEIILKVLMHQFDDAAFPHDKFTTFSIFQYQVLTENNLGELFDPASFSCAGILAKTPLSHAHLFG